jgi:hypothetical protein
MYLQIHQSERISNTVLLKEETRLSQKKKRRKKLGTCRTMKAIMQVDREGQP